MNFFVDGSGVYEDTGDPCCNRLILRALPDGELVEGPGLGREALRLIVQVPLNLIGIAQLNAKKEG